MTELIFHIGGGKTGSSSIQATLKANQEMLLSEGISYWGLMLEEAPIRRFTWQRPVGANEYYADGNSSKDLAELISECLEHCDAKGVRKAIWSNEWFLGSAYEFERNKPTLEAIRNLIDDGYMITVIAYIRDHISWAVSAYFQWGIKHKTYTGDLMDFEKYTAKRPPRFYEPLNAWKEASDGNLKLFNFNRAGNVVDHFLKYVRNGANADYECIIDNQSPNKLENFLRAAFNQSLSKGNQYEPIQFNLALLKLLEQCNERNLVKWYNNLIPNEDSIDSLILASNDDIISVNHMLVECGEPVLSVTRPSKSLKIGQENMEQLISLVTQLMLGLAEKNQSLEHQLNSLHKTLKNQSLGTA